jgi:hypothetical protein
MPDEEPSERLSRFDADALLQHLSPDEIIGLLKWLCEQDPDFKTQVIQMLEAEADKPPP